MKKALSSIGIRRKASAVVILTLSIALGFFAWISLRTVTNELTAGHAHAVASMARGLALAVEVPVTTGDTRELSRIAKGFLEQSPGAVFVLIRDPNGATLNYQGEEASRYHASSLDRTDNQKSWGLKDPFCAATATVRGIVAADDDLAGLDSESEPMMDSIEGSESAGAVSVGLSMEPLRREIRVKSRMFAAVFVVSLAAFMPLVWYLVGGLTLRLGVLAGAAERISVGDVDRPVETGGGDEIGKLAVAFEAMRLAVRERNQQLQRFAETLQDQVRERTVELERAMHAAEGANRAKSEFLANMSHEIRTPMNAILGFAETLAEPNQTDEERSACVRTIARSGEHLLGIINDILDVSKVEAGMMSVEAIVASPAAVLSDSVAILKNRADEKRIALTLSFASPVPDVAACDPGRLRQVLVNLIGNGIKFTERGSVDVVAGFAGGADGGVLTVSVRDTGVGIGEEAMARLFRPFEQGDGSMSRRFGGTGLGLVIARSLAQLMGGDISVKSAAGHGTCFTCTTWLGGPVGKLRESPVEFGAVAGATVEGGVAGRVGGGVGQADEDVAGVRVLLVEDGDDNARLIQHHLGKMGVVVERAENGRIGIEKYMAMRSRAEGPEVIFMDMQMPEVDGYEASSRLRAMGCTTPIIALTAHALTGDREKCLAAGCDDYLTKPIKRAILFDTLRRWDAARVARAA